MKIREILWVTFLVSMVLPLVSFRTEFSRKRTFTKHDLYMSAYLSDQDQRAIQVTSNTLEISLSIVLHIGLYLTGISLGLYDYFIEVMRCLKQLIIHPLSSLREFIHAVSHYDETYLKVKDVIIKILGAYPHFSAAQKARLHAMVFSEIVLFFSPVTIPGSQLVRSVASSALEQIKRASAVRVSTKTRKWFNQFDPVVAAEWFASEGQSNR